ncbi:MAG: hypothetical protein KKD17_00685 [Nanoarchaeota archaeon]|nr:hypothetical protein [Nanoarchaeota archaeon]
MTQTGEVEQCLGDILAMEENVTEIDLSDLEQVIEEPASASAMTETESGERANPFSSINERYIELSAKNDASGRGIPRLTVYVDWAGGKGYMMGATPEHIGMYIEQLAKSGERIDRELGEAILHPEYMGQIRRDYGEKGAQYVTATVQKLMQGSAKVVSITAKKSAAAERQALPNAACQ